MSSNWDKISVDGFEFFHNSRLIRRTEQNELQKVQRLDQGLNVDHFL